MNGPQVLRPGKRRTALRAFLGTVALVIGIGATTSGAAPIGIPVALVGAFLWAMTLLILLKPRAYELHLDDRGFRVHDIFGRPVHDVAWSELAGLRPVNVLTTVIVVAFVCSPRRPKHGRIRWRRGTADDDGCMPDTYDQPADRLMTTMYGYWERATGGAAPRATAPDGIAAF